VLCCAVLCCAALRCAVLTSFVLCCAVPLMQALPPNNQPLSPASASTLSKWICDGPKGKDAGIDSKLDGLMSPSHTTILWAAALCKVVRNNFLLTEFAGNLKCPGIGQYSGGKIANITHIVLFLLWT
jgi:hypothetical protein